MTLVIRDGHVRTVVARPLRQPDASKLCAKLGKRGIDVLIETGPIVHVTALAPVDTRQEVRALTEVTAVTDAPIAWHGAVDRG